MEAMDQAAMNTDEKHFQNSLLLLHLISPATVISLRFLQAPYGKHRRPGWGPAVPATVAWIFMESPTLWLTFLVFSLGRFSCNPRALSLISVFLLHYIHRTCVYPFRLTRRNNSANFPLSIAALGFGFNLLNCYVQARWVSHYADYGADPSFWWRFSAGFMVFMCGLTVNVRADLTLIGLKKGGGGYQIPRGGLFEVVSCPNYLGEIVEWLGWAIMTWAWAGLGFFLYSCANLVPRASANHKWYSDKFGGDYPKNRKAVIPFLF